MTHTEMMSKIDGTRRVSRFHRLNYIRPIVLHIAALTVYVILLRSFNVEALRKHQQHDDVKVQDKKDVIMISRQKHGIDQSIQQSRRNNEYSNVTQNASLQCLYCHLLFPEVMPFDMEGSVKGQESNSFQAIIKRDNEMVKYDQDEVHCLTKVDGFSLRHPLTIYGGLSSDFLRQHRSLIEKGEAHFCIHKAYIAKQQQKTHHADTESNIDQQQEPQQNNDASLFDHHVMATYKQSNNVKVETSSPRRGSHYRHVVIPNDATFELLQEGHPIRRLQNSWPSFSKRARGSAITSNSNSNENEMTVVNDTQYHFGTKRLLVVRIVTANHREQPEETLDEIEGAIFGTGPNPNNIAEDSTVVGQYRAVSQHNLFFIPAAVVLGGNDTKTPGTTSSSDTTVTISNGVIEIELPSYIETFVNESIREYLVPEILQATERALGGNLQAVADYFVFCIPNHSLLRDDAQWTAFTYLFERYSYYQQSRCTKLSVVMHEMGHGLGFKHSGQGTNEYADKSGYMGYAVNFAGFPRKAFNGHKHWISGWFRDHSLELTSKMIDEGMQIRLAAFVDYRAIKEQEKQQQLTGRTRNHNYYVLLRVNQVIYIQYNLAADYNLHTDPEYANKLTIVEAHSNTDVSYLQSVLGPGGKYLYIINSTSIVIIQVCDMIEGSDAESGDEPVRYATVSIYYMNDEDGVDDVTRCNFNHTISSQPYRTTSKPTLFPSTASDSFSDDNESKLTPSNAPVLKYPEVLQTSPTTTPFVFEKPQILSLNPHSIAHNATSLYDDDKIQIEGKYSEANTAENSTDNSRKRSMLLAFLITAVVCLGLLLVIIFGMYLQRHRSRENMTTTFGTSRIISKISNSKGMTPSIQQKMDINNTKTGDSSVSDSSDIENIFEEYDNLHCARTSSGLAKNHTEHDAEKNVRCSSSPIDGGSNLDPTNKLVNCTRMSIVSSPTKVEAILSPRLNNLSENLENNTGLSTVQASPSLWTIFVVPSNHDQNLNNQNFIAQETLQHHVPDGAQTISPTIHRNNLCNSDQDTKRSLPVFNYSTPKATKVSTDCNTKNHLRNPIDLAMAMKAENGNGKFVCHSDGHVVQERLQL